MFRIHVLSEELFETGPGFGWISSERKNRYEKVTNMANASAIKVGG